MSAVTRRRMAVHCLAVGVLVSLVLAGCAENEGRRAGTADSGEPLALAEQVLAVAVGEDGYLDAPPGLPVLGKSPLDAGMFEPLVRMNERFEVEPALAERWEYSQATNTYRFQLRRGVRFHDGAELTSADVKYTFDLVNRAIPQNDEALTPEAVKVVDRYTVDFTPTRTNTRLVEGLTSAIASISREGSSLDRPVGTGPYRFIDYVRNDRIVVERFDGYWNADGAAKATRITFRFVGDDQTRVLALRSGEVDLIVDVSRDQAPQLERTAGLRLVRAPPGASNGLLWNIAGAEPHTFGRDARVREAVALAIDRARVVDAVWGANAEQSATVLPAAVLGRFASLVQGPRYDPDRARRLLDEAGYRPGSDGIRVKDGKPLTLHYLVGVPASDHVPGPELIQEQLRRVGVELRLEVPGDQAVHAARVRDGGFDIRQRMFFQDEAHPCRIPERFHSRIGGLARFVAPGGATDRAIEGCRSSVELEESRRNAAEAVRQLVDVERVILPLAAVASLSAMKDKVGGFLPYPSSVTQRWEGVHLVR